MVCVIIQNSLCSIMSACLVRPQDLIYFPWPSSVENTSWFAKFMLSMHPHSVCGCMLSDAKKNTIFKKFLVDVEPLSDLDDMVKTHIAPHNISKIIPHSIQFTMSFDNCELD